MEILFHEANGWFSDFICTHFISCIRLGDLVGRGLFLHVLSFTSAKIQTLSVELMLIWHNIGGKKRCPRLSLQRMCTPLLLIGGVYNCLFGEGNSTHSSALAWKIPWTEEPGRLQSMRSLRVGHDWATSLWLFTFMDWRRKWQPTPVFLPGESQGPVGYIFPFLLCLSLLIFPHLFVKPPQTPILPFCISFP